ncbi:hypothetical protein [Anaerofustis sp. NSJ-163]|uniref:hypothetical protein n=1 Tax=Anaerofustis sp. NSJ-163 TaxID=2944391 RepID=UPI00209C567F|nr:hypothetical protein [Anaerofustis sp. NSJ-163]MCO8193018.1 hypothetical protein [Anaerofustis sp. NSJ-163]
MSNKKDKYKINYSTYVSGGRAVGKSGSYKKGSTGINGAISGMLSSMSGVGKNISKSSSSKNSSSTGIKGAISSAGSSISRFANGDGSRNSSESNTNLDYNVKKYMGQRGGTFGDKSYTKIGDDFYLKANPYSGVDMKKNNKPKLLKENQYNISEENREKINKEKIESYIKGINPYSAPPKNIRDAKAKESVESLMNNIQKRKNEQVKKENEEYHKGISQAMSNYRPYGVDQRNTGKTQNNLLSSYPSYGSRVTKEDLADYSTALNQFAKNRQTNLAAKEAEKQKKQAANLANKKITSQVMSNFRPYGVDQRNTGKTQNNLFSSYPSYGSRVSKEDLAEFNTALNNYAVNRNAKIAKREAEKQKQQGNKEQNKKPAYVGEFRQNADNQSNKEKTYAYQYNSVPGQPTTKNFTKEHLGDAVPEYKTQDDINNELKTVENEYSNDSKKDIDKYINKADSIAVNDTNAGSYYDDNPYASFQKNSKYNRTGNEEDKTGYDYMTKNEISTAKYILGKYGAKAQAEYLKNLKGRLVEREATDYIKRELSGASPAKLRWESYKAGVAGKFRDIFQTGSVMGGNNNLLQPSVFETAINRKYEKSSDETKKLMKRWHTAGDSTVSIGANAINPVLGNAIDIASDYGDSYTSSLRNSSQTKEDAKKAEKTALFDTGKDIIISKGIDIPNSAIKKQINKKYGDKIDTMLSKGLNGKKLNEKHLNRKKARIERGYDSIIENILTNRAKDDKYLY